MLKSIHFYLRQTKKEKLNFRKGEYAEVLVNKFPLYENHVTEKDLVLLYIKFVVFR